MVLEELHQLVVQPEILGAVADLVLVVEPSCMVGLTLQSPETEALPEEVVLQQLPVILLLLAMAACSVVAAALPVVPVLLLLEMAVLRVEVAVLVATEQELLVLAAQAL
jgi:hypothetical protein